MSENEHLRNKEGSSNRKGHLYSLDTETTALISDLADMKRVSRSKIVEHAVRHMALIEGISPSGRVSVSVQGIEPVSARWPAAMLVSTAAEYLDCSSDQVERLIRARAIGAVRFTERGDRRLLKSEIDVYLDRLRAERIKQ